ncbi:MAG: hypothetical protein JSR46_10550 [Verrucomicrobia bacterium]|nr:hypothetical protein [Verrucomicrobiota bacterium]
MRVVLILLFGILAIPLLHGQELNVQYERLDGPAFHERIVGNTVVGITRQSKSLYMLYFAQDGVCELSKGQQIYAGKWWIDKDALG